jgi:Tfp pilus assembly protein PilX
MSDSSKKGMILFIVIGLVMIVAILTTVILGIIANHSRLTHHMVSRVQAQYAAKAGLVYALEMLRTGTWTYSPTNSCPSPTGCEVSDSSFPSSVIDKKAHVIFCPKAPGGCRYASGELHPCRAPEGIDFCINSTVDFTYTAS